MLRKDRQVVENADARRVGDREHNRHRAGVDGGDLELPPLDLQRIAEGTLGAQRVHRLKREHHIVGRQRLAVREGDARMQLQRERPPVLRGTPTVRQPGLHCLRRLVDANQLGVREDGHELGAGVAVDVAIEGAGLGSNGGDQAAATPDDVVRRGGCLRGRWLAGSTRSGGRERGKYCHRGRRGDETLKTPELSGQKLPYRPRNWPVKTKWTSNKDSRNFSCKRPPVTGFIQQQPVFWLRIRRIHARASRGVSQPTLHAATT
jgi:hypothetical protein